MGVLDFIKSHNDSKDATSAADKSETEKTVFDVNAASDGATPERKARPQSDDSDSDSDKEEELGVKKAEAASLVWSKKALIGIYVWMWICYFMLAFHLSIGTNVINNAYSSFSTAPEISTANILASIIGGVMKLPIAKVLNVWGRAEGLAMFLTVYVIGIIVIASCDGPNGYAAGYVLYYVGYDAIYFIMQVFIADTSGLRNRAWAFAFVFTPYIATAFLAPLAAQSFLNGAGWRWAYGAFAVIMPVVFGPLIFTFKYFQLKAKKLDLYAPDKSGRTFWESCVHLFWEFDVVGCILLMAAWVMFLLPWSLQSYGKSTYNSASFIALIIVGFCLFFVFAAWEKWFARICFIRWELLKQRTLVGACGLSAVLYFSFYCWDLYYFNFCIVVYNLTVKDTGYMGQIYNVGGSIWGVVFGLYIKWSKHFKWPCLFFGLPLMFLGAGLMIHFRGNNGGIGYVVMCQIFIAFSGGTLIIGEEMAVMACAKNLDGVPLMLSLLGLASSLGGAVGYAVAAAIYANTFPNALQRALPADTAADWSTIYEGGYTFQMEYPVGNSTRNAIDYAYGQNQRYSCIAATAVLVLAIPAIAVWENFNVDKKTLKGTVL